MLSKGIGMLHDNAHPQWLIKPKISLGHLTDYPPYSPNQTPSDYHLFLHLDSQCHDDDDDVVKTIMLQWLSNQVESLYEDGIQKQILRYNNFLNSNGNYIEKWIKVQACRPRWSWGNVLA